MKQPLNSVLDLHLAWEGEDQWVQEDDELKVLDKEEREDPLEIQIQFRPGIYINYDFYPPGYMNADGNSKVPPTMWEIYDYSNDETYFMTDENLEHSKFGQAMAEGRLYLLN